MFSVFLGASFEAAVALCKKKNQGFVKKKKNQGFVKKKNQGFVKKIKILLYLGFRIKRNKEPTNRERGDKEAIKK